MADMWRFHQLRVLHPGASPELIMAYMANISGQPLLSTESSSMAAELGANAETGVTPRIKGKGKGKKGDQPLMAGGASAQRRSREKASKASVLRMSAAAKVPAKSSDSVSTPALPVKRLTKQTKSKPTAKAPEITAPSGIPSALDQSKRTGRPKKDTQKVDGSDITKAAGQEAVEGRKGKTKKRKAGHDDPDMARDGDNADSVVEADKMKGKKRDALTGDSGPTSGTSNPPAGRTDATPKKSKKDKKDRQGQKETEDKQDQGAGKGQKGQEAQVDQKAKNEKKEKKEKKRKMPRGDGPISISTPAAITGSITSSATLPKSTASADQPTHTSAIPAKLTRTPHSAAKASTSIPAPPPATAISTNNTKKRKKLPLENIPTAEAENERERKERKKRKMEKKAARESAAAAAAANVATGAGQGGIVIEGLGARALMSEQISHGHASLAVARAPKHLTWATETPAAVKKAKHAKVKTGKVEKADSASKAVTLQSDTSPAGNALVTETFSAYHSRPSPDHSPSHLFTPPHYPLPPHLHALGSHNDSSILAPETPTTTRPGAYLTGRNAHLTNMTNATSGDGYEYDELATPCQPVLFARRL